MKAFARTMGWAALAAGLSAATLGQARQGVDRSQPATASTKGYEQADMRMMKDMHIPYSGDPDIDFRTHMIPHHQGAIDMAKVALRYAKDPATKAMAQRIVDDQEREIGEMTAWLKAHGH